MSPCGVDTCGKPVRGLLLCTVGNMSLFDARSVTPPSPCAGCGEKVPASSFFCPDCGQSMISDPAPSSKIRKMVADARDSTKDVPDFFEESPGPKTTGWLRRSLNFGKRITVENAEGSQDPQISLPEQDTQELSLFEMELSDNSRGEKTRVQRPPTRFVLKFDNGMQHTLGETPGIIGVRPSSGQDMPGMHRISLEDPSGTVALDHLEFGNRNGVFWVKDLKSVNGTVVEEPGTRPLQCIPFDTYSLVRSSRVTIGAVSFTLH